MSLPIRAVARAPKISRFTSLLLSKRTLEECPNCREIFLEYNINIQISPNEGEAFLKMLEEKSPDAALLEVFMPGLDALEVKKRYDKSCTNTTVFYAMGLFYSDSILKELIDSGFVYYFMKPFHADALGDRINRYISGESWLPQPVTDIQRVTLMLRELGMPAHLLGFNFVRQAIGLVLENPARYGSGAVTIRLYPDVAMQNNTTASRVERAIRHAIEVSFDRCNPEALENYFGSSVNGSKGKATNSEFIATLSDRIHVGRSADGHYKATSTKGWF